MFRSTYVYSMKYDRSPTMHNEICLLKLLCRKTSVMLAGAMTMSLSVIF